MTLAQLNEDLQDLLNTAERYKQIFGVPSEALEQLIKMAIRNFHIDKNIKKVNNSHPVSVELELPYIAPQQNWVIESVNNKVNWS